VTESNHETNDDQLQEWYRRALLRLSISADDIFPDLNTELDLFRDLLRKRTNDINTLDTQLEKVENQTDNFHQLYKDLFNSNRQSFKSLIRILNHVDQSPEVTHDLETLLDVVKHSEGQLIDSIGWLASITNISNKISVQEGDNSHELLQQVKHDISRLLARLQGASNDAAEIEVMQTQLSEAQSFIEVRACLRQISTFLLELIFSGQKEFESYLEGINNHLATIRENLNLTTNTQKEIRLEEKTFTNEMRNHIALLNTKIDDMPAVGQIKEEIGDQLFAIAQNLERFNHNSNQREQTMSEQLSSLKNQVNDLEKENRKFHAEIELNRRQAYTDSLTNLPNRADWERRSEQDFLHFQRYGHNLVLAICDLDFFKNVNDTYGHQAGDRVLKIVARKLKDGIRETDFVARIGGEEFVILMPETSMEDAFRVCEKIRLSIADSNLHFKGSPVNLTISIGLAQFEQNSLIDDVFANADRLLYQAKNNGRNQICFDNNET
jgi:diguanylate cyclase